MERSAQGCKHVGHLLDQPRRQRGPTASGKTPYCSLPRRSSSMPSVAKGDSSCVAGCHLGLSQDALLHPKGFLHLLGLLRMEAAMQLQHTTSQPLCGRCRPQEIQAVQDVERADLRDPRRSAAGLLAYEQWVKQALAPGPSRS